MKVKCDNCGWTGSDQEADGAADVHLRHEFGDTFSDLECPECGALVFEEKNRFTVEIDCDNAYFGEMDDETGSSLRAERLAALLRRVADRLEPGESTFPILDFNGNRVGYARSVGEG